MENISYFMDFTLFCIMAGMLFVCFYFAWLKIKEVREQRKLSFDILYKKIECILDSYPVTERTMNKLLELFGEIRKMKYKDKKAIEKLWDLFCEKYKALGQEIMLLDEFEPSMIFTGE